MTHTFSIPDDVAIELSGLCQHFGAVRAIDGVDLTLRAGEVVALLGPNGAGKTTTLDAILGFLSPTLGTVRVLGTEPARAIAAGRVAAVLQSGGLLADLTVRETLELVGSLFPHAMRADAAAARAGIGHLAAHRVGMLSGGEKQRLRFALAVLPDPDLLVLDEPTTGMDTAARREFWNAIQADAAAGRTIVFATHYLQEADAYAERIVLMAEGRIVADGAPAAIKAAASSRILRATIPPGGAGGSRGEVDQLVNRLGGLAGVRSVSLNGGQLVVHATDTDLVAHHLLEHSAARDLEIAATSIEDAFLTLTASDRAGAR